MAWKRPSTELLNTRRGLVAGPLVGPAGLVGYLARNPHPTPAGAAEMLVAVILATCLVVGLAARTNRELRRRSARDGQG